MQCACAVLYCHLRLVWFYKIVPRHFICSKISGKNFVEHKVCYNFIYNFRLQRVILRKLSQMYMCLHEKYPACLSDFWETWIFSADLRKTSIYKISWKCEMCPAKTEPIHADGRSYRHDEVNTRFSQFCERPSPIKKETCSCLWNIFLKLNALPLQFHLKSPCPLLPWTTVCMDLTKTVNFYCGLLLNSLTQSLTQISPVHTPNCFSKF